MSSKSNVKVSRVKKIKSLETTTAEKKTLPSDQLEAQAADSEGKNDYISSTSDMEEGYDSVDLSQDSVDESDKEDEFPLKKKAKKSKHDDGSTEFSNAVNAILSSHLKAYDRKDPIMARNKKVLKRNESDKLEQQARKALSVEKKKQLNKARKKEIVPVVGDDKSGEEIRNVLEREAKLRKIARKGVVKLFNAILSTQVNTAREVEANLGDVRNREEREQLITEVSKEKFLDMVKAAAEEE